MISCLNCGQCCFYEIAGVKKKCKYLVQLKSRTICRIYKNRLGVIIDYDPQKERFICCALRSKDPRIFINCPLNNNF